MPATWRITKNQLPALHRWLSENSLVTVQRDPNIVIPYIKEFGRSVRENFQYEGFPGGQRDWVKLKNFTMEERERRGYPRDHPVMHQSGQLRDLASKPFFSWRKGQKSINPKRATTPYGDQTALTVAADIRFGVFAAVISGERVKNQTAYSISKRSGDSVGVPARPFWGFSGGTNTVRGISNAVPEGMSEFFRVWVEMRKGVG